MIITTTDFIPNKKIIAIDGVVRGSTIRAKHIGTDILAGLKNLVGGELKGYTAMINEARDQAVERMIEEAKKLKSDAVINIRYATAEVMPGTAEVMAYGTAVKIKK